MPPKSALAPSPDLADNAPTLPDLGHRPDPGTLADSLDRPGVLSSPAARLQATLGAEFAEYDGEARWPLRWTVAMVFSTCGAFWTGVYFLVAALIG